MAIRLPRTPTGYRLTQLMHTLELKSKTLSKCLKERISACSQNGSNKA